MRTLGLLLLAAVALAGPDEEALFAKALLAHERSRDLVVAAEIKHEKPEAAAWGGPGGPLGGVVIQTNVGGASAPPFEGKVEAWRDADGATVVVGGEPTALPRFAMHVTKEKTIKQVTFEGEQPPDLGQIEAELVALLDTKRFAKHMEKAHLTATRDDATGDWIFKGEVPRKVVRPARGGGGFDLITPSKVLTAEAVCRVSAEGRFREIEIKLTRNDPEAEMMRMIQKQGPPGLPVAPGQGGGADDDDDDDEHETKGGTTTYSLKVQAENAPPGERLREAAKAVAPR